VYLIEAFLPLVFPDGEGVPSAIFELIQAELTEAFGGVTVYSRRPVTGVWKKDDDTEMDVLIILEVMVKDVDKDWWKDFRRRVEALLHQDEVLIRATSIVRL
jgi:hypothetical protein